MTNAGEPCRVTHVLWRLSRSGGVQTVVRTLIASVDPRTVALSVVTARPRLAEDGLDDLPVPVIGLDHSSSRLRLRDRVRIATSVRRHVRRNRPDVVHLHSGTVWMAMLARLGSRRTGWLVEVHDAPGSGRHSRSTDLVEGWWVALNRASVVCHSTSVADAVRRRWHLKAKRVQTFPLSVDLERFAPSAERRATARERLGLDAGAVVLAVVGRMVPSKRLDRVVRVLARLDGSVRALFIGDGPERATVLALADEMGVAARVVATGHLADAELADAVCGADVLVSTSEYEGFGLSLVEGMSAGLPVVATAVGGVTDIVVDGTTGRLVAPHDEAALYDALRALVADAATREAMGRAGRVRAAERYSPAQLATSFTRVYEQLAGR